MSHWRPPCWSGVAQREYFSPWQMPLPHPSWWPTSTRYVSRSFLAWRPTSMSLLSVAVSPKTLFALRAYTTVRSLYALPSRRAVITSSTASCKRERFLRERLGHSCRFTDPEVSQFDDTIVGRLLFLRPMVCDLLRQGGQPWPMGCEEPTLHGARRKMFYCVRLDRVAGSPVATVVRRLTARHTVSSAPSLNAFFLHTISSRLQPV